MHPRPSTTLRLFGLITGVLFVFPGLYLVWRNLTLSADTLGLLTSSVTLGPLSRSLLLATVVSLSAAFIGTTLAWVSTRTDVPFRRLWRVVLPLPLVLPSFIGAAAFIRTLSTGGLASRLIATVGPEVGIEIRGLFGAWLVLTLVTYPYVYLPVAARLVRLPSALEESARLLGDDGITAFRRAVFPQLRASIGAGTLLVFLYTISDFGGVQLMRYDTLTRAIETNYLARPPVALTLSLFLLAVAAVVVLGERLISRGDVTAETARSQRPITYNLGKAKPLVTLWVCVVALIGVAAPVVALIDWAGDGVLRLAGSGRELTIDGTKLVEASWNTMESSLLAALVSVLVVIPIALLVARHNDPVGRASHGLVIATFAIPGILIALAMRFWTIRSGWAGDLLYDTKALLVFGYVVRFGSLAMGVTLLAVKAVPTRLHDVAGTLGASKWKRLLTVDLPLMAPGLAAAFGLVLLSAMKELPISLILAPLGYHTLTTRIFGSFEEAFIAEAGLMAILLVGLSAIASWVLVLRRAEHF